MDTNNAIRILEMLAAGCSPETGELINGESVLNQRDAIRALQIAIDNLQKGTPTDHTNVNIDEEDIKAAIQLFLEQDYTPTKNRLRGFFLATRAFKNAALTSNTLYGKYEKLYTNGQLTDFFTNYLRKNENTDHRKIANQEEKNAPWKNIDFFQQKKFNNLSQADIDQLREQVDELGVTKVDNLADYVITARKEYPRAYEPWNETEKRLLDEALKHTNDITILMQCFQRGEGAIRSCGKKIIYQRGKI